MLGTWMSLPTLSSLTMVLCVAPWLFTMKFWKTISLIFGFTVKFFLGGFCYYFNIIAYVDVLTWNILFPRMETKESRKRNPKKC